MMFRHVGSLLIPAAADVFMTRVVASGKRGCVVVCQNENGPCPLIAICNVLLLRGTLSLHPDCCPVNLGHLVQLLTDALLAPSPRQHNTAADKTAHEQSVQTAVELFPELQYGLDVNVRFDNCRGFEFTRTVT